MTYWYLLAAALVSGAAALTLWRRFSYSENDLAIVTAIVAAFVAFGCLGTFVDQNLDRAACTEKGQQTGLNVEYHLLSGCYVQVDGQLIPYDKWIKISGVNAP